MDNFETKIRNVIRAWKNIRSDSGLNWSTIDWGEGISAMEDALLDLESVLKSERKETAVETRLERLEKMGKHLIQDVERISKEEKEVPLNIEPPKNDRWVLVAIKDEPWWDVDCWFGHYWDGNEDEDVLGWMELPERHRRKEREKC